MHNHLYPAHIECPYCGEGLEILLDYSAGNHAYIEDCQVCCSPIEITVEMDATGEQIAIHCKRDMD
ncbi:MAG: CPXCG motif-containing cysteine-rich protein [Gammaproteobacteria bacterium]|jgi:hypothetical protein|nr:CPXCG motif-containing cysteine-rich protein [Gammaproteobacteria bacterium]